MPPTDLEIYSLEGSIEKFFKSHPSVTREACDELAASIAGKPVLPVPIQGSCSYTVTAGPNSSIIQFRAGSSPLNLDKLKLAQTTYGPFLASCTRHEGISPLHVYSMDKIPGITYIEAQVWPDVGKPLSPGQESRLANTVIDFAKFFASSWIKPQVVDSSTVNSLFSEYQQRIGVLATNLPSHFLEKLSDLSPKLPSIFSSQYPLVLNHIDLNGTNILVDAETGHLTGITDWNDARIAPFGVSLWGLENVLGKMDLKGWHTYDNREALAGLFWETFEKEIGSAPD